jgi:hypothetical protein
MMPCYASFQQHSQQIHCFAVQHEAQKPRRLGVRPGFEFEFEKRAGLEAHVLC